MSEEEVVPLPQEPLQKTQFPIGSFEKDPYDTDKPKPLVEAK